jgi:uncharacterized protein YciI
MLIINLEYKKPLAEVNKYLEDHRNFLQKYYDKNMLIASGPKDPRTGGIILANIDKESIEQIIKEDPFYQNNIADYTITVFDPVKCSDEFKLILEK